MAEEKSGKKYGIYLIFVFVFMLFSFQTYSLELGNTAEEIKVSSDEMAKISLFLSNFTEVRMKKFDVNSVTSSELVDFSMEHNYLNNKKTRVKDVAKAGQMIAREDLEESVKKYFDLELADYIDANCSGYTFKTYNKHNIIYVKAIKVYEMDNGNFYIKGKLYDVENKSKIFGSVDAIVKKHNFKGKESYALIELLVKE